MLENDRDVVRRLLSKYRDFWSSFDKVLAFFFWVQNCSVGLSDVTSKYPTPESRNSFSECPTSHRSDRLRSRDPLSDCPTPGQSLRSPSPETPCRILRPCVGLSDPEAIQSVPFVFRFCIGVFQITPRVNISLVGVCDLGDSSERRVGLNFGT